MAYSDDNLRPTAGARLTTKARKALPTKSFALPGRRYPIQNESHARNALARVSQHGDSEEKARVRAAVKRRYPGIKQAGQAGGSIQAGARGQQWGQAMPTPPQQQMAPPMATGGQPGPQQMQPGMMPPGGMISPQWLQLLRQQQAGGMPAGARMPQAGQGSDFASALGSWNPNLGLAGMGANMLAGRPMTIPAQGLGQPQQGQQRPPLAGLMNLFRGPPGTSGLPGEVAATQPGARAPAFPKQAGVQGFAPHMQAPHLGGTPAPPFMRAPQMGARMELGTRQVPEGLGMYSRYPMPPYPGWGQAGARNGADRPPRIMGESYYASGSLTEGSEPPMGWHEEEEPHQQGARMPSPQYMTPSMHHPYGKQMLPGIAGQYGARSEPVMPPPPWEPPDWAARQGGARMPNGSAGPAREVIQRLIAQHEARKPPRGHGQPASKAPELQAGARAPGNPAVTAPGMEAARAAGGKMGPGRMPGAHMHALTMASAKHLASQGHISQAHHHQIRQHAANALAAMRAPGAGPQMGMPGGAPPDLMAGGPPGGPGDGAGAMPPMGGGGGAPLSLAPPGPSGGPEMM